MITALKNDEWLCWFFMMINEVLIMIINDILFTWMHRYAHLPYAHGKMLGILKWYDQYKGDQLIAMLNTQY